VVDAPLTLTEPAPEYGIETDEDAPPLTITLPEPEWLGITLNEAMTEP
jgi:hypothetical protein